MRGRIALRRFYQTMDRERKHLLHEVMQVRGLMPLLMKQRNNQRWTAEDKRELIMHLKRLSKISPYIAVIVMPGGFAMLPVIAWWLDRRRGRRALTGPR
ncbi:MAG: hypothetical protein IT514_01130 [Burkholderiales bacterium]|nr:hypothetical protein [Burkholderiales bacterium]